MSSMEENKNMADDLADGAKTAAQDAKTLDVYKRQHQSNISLSIRCSILS